MSNREDQEPPFFGDIEEFEVIHIECPYSVVAAWYTHASTKKKQIVYVVKKNGFDVFYHTQAISCLNYINKDT